MSIQNEGDYRTIECDCGCGEHFEARHRDDFHAMIDDAKMAGWKINLSNGEWEHYAPACAGGSRLERARRMFGL